MVCYFSIQNKKKKKTKKQMVDDSPMADKEGEQFYSNGPFKIFWMKSGKGNVGTIHINRELSLLVFILKKQNQQNKVKLLNPVGISYTFTVYIIKFEN